jgi:hypothetical protein
MLGGTIKDTALLSGLHEPTGEGTLTFHLYSDAGCTVAIPGFSYEIKGIKANGEYDSAAFTPEKLGKYYWRVVFSGDVNNDPETSPCNAPGEVSEVTQAQPAISTVATESMRIGEPIKDTAEITGLVKPTGTGTITFRLYSDERCTVPVPGFSSPSEKVTENSSFTSAEFPTANAGLHYWIAEFSGDDNNKAVKTQCRDGDEVSLVREAQPAIKTSATATAIVGQTIEDTATLEGLVSAEGTGAVTFKLFDNDECKGTPVHEFTTASGISGSGTQPVSSDKFTTAKAGTYFWIASFAGDNNNNPIASKCLDPKESSDVVPTTPKIKTSATASAIVGQTLEDTATLEGLVNAEGTGKVTFKLFDNGDCEGTPVHEFTTATGISGSGTQNVSSDEFTTAKTGTYFWIASFAGDKNNDPIASKCLDANESSDVDKALPKVTTAATVEVASVGDKIKDVATLSGLVNPDGTGKVTFRLYSNHNCEGAPLFESTNPSPGGISANGPVSSDEHAIEAPGTYFWVASYSGDAHNKPASTGCGEVGESTVVEQAQPGITTSATSMQVVGGKIKDIATLSGLVKPTGTGTVTFKLYRDSECKSEVFSSTSSGIVTNGPVPSGEYPANAAGTYFWVASYSGDAHNRGVSSGCAAEPVVVDPAIPSLTTTPEPTSGVVGTTFKDKAVMRAVRNAAGRPGELDALQQERLFGQSGERGPDQRERKRRLQHPGRRETRKNRHLLLGRLLQRRCQQQGRFLCVRSRADRRRRPWPGLGPRPAGMHCHNGAGVRHGAGDQVRYVLYGRSPAQDKDRRAF